MSQHLSLPGSRYPDGIRQGIGEASLDQHDTVQVAADQESLLLVAHGFPTTQRQQKAAPALDATAPELGKPAAATLEGALFAMRRPKNRDELARAGFARVACYLVDSRQQNREIRPETFPYTSANLEKQDEFLLTFPFFFTTMYNIGCFLIARRQFSQQ